MHRSSLFRVLQRSVSVSVANARKNSIPSRFSSVPHGPEDPILGVTVAYNHDPSPRKINLGVGTYRDDAGFPFVLPSVREAERRLLDRNLDMEYLPVAGYKPFIEKATRLAFGDNEDILGEHCAAIQALSGTGACRMAGAFLHRWYKGPGPNGKALVLMPTPTWANHPKIFGDAGCEVGQYPYYDPVTHSLDFDGLKSGLAKAPEGAVVLLHACAHNPTGVDPSTEQWVEISALMKEKGLLPLFDMAYQGFTSGDTDKDAEALRYFVEHGHKVILAQSFSKNFGLYGHRVGCLSILTDSKKEKLALESQLKILARPMYSNPPIHGVRIVNEVLSNKDLEESWRKEMRGMAEQIISMRARLKQTLVDLGSTLNWNHIVNQHGMFCFSGLSKDHVDMLRKDHSVYLTANGRISMAGVHSDNVSYLAKAMHDVTSRG